LYFAFPGGRSSGKENGRLCTQASQKRSQAAFPSLHIGFLDIVIIAFLIYKLIVWTKKRALIGAQRHWLLFLCSIVSQLLSLTTLSWLLDSILTSGSIIIVLFILFQRRSAACSKSSAAAESASGRLLDVSNLKSTALIRDMQTAILSLSRAASAR
jgi:DNA integrity scanning protein DisA with diadenylate cyclase activity